MQTIQQPPRPSRLVNDGHYIAHLPLTVPTSVLVDTCRRSKIIMKLTVAVSADGEAPEGLREAAGHLSLWPVHYVPLQSTCGE